MMVFALSSVLFAQKLVYSPDGRSIAAAWKLDFNIGSDATQYIIFDAATGKIKTTADLNVPADFLVYGRDGRSLVAADRLILEHIFIDEKGKAAFKYVSSKPAEIDDENQRLVNSDMIGVAISADGKRLYKILPNFLDVYTYPEMQPIASEKKQYLPGDDKFENRFIGISPDAGLIAEERFEGNESFLFITDTAKKVSEKFVKFEMLPDNTVPRQAVVFSENKSTMMLRTYEGRELRSRLSFWDVKTKKQLTVFGNELLDLYETESPNFYLINEAVLSPDGTKAAIRFDAVREGSGIATFIEIIDLKTNKTATIETTTSDLGRDFEAMAFSPDSKQLATFSTVLKPGTLEPKLEIWNAATAKKIR